MASQMIERDMYGGEIHIVHNPNARGRQPRYLVNGTQKPKGVTTILGDTLAKDLMDWAVSCCVDSLKQKLPVITEQDLAEAANELLKQAYPCATHDILRKENSSQERLTTQKGTL